MKYALFAGLACIAFAGPVKADQAFDNMMNQFNSQKFNPHKYDNLLPNKPSYNQRGQDDPTGTQYAPNTPTIGPDTSGQQICPTDPVYVQRWDSRCGTDAEETTEGGPGAVVLNSANFLCDCHNVCVFQGCVESGEPPPPQ